MLLKIRTYTVFQIFWPNKGYNNIGKLALICQKFKLWLLGFQTTQLGLEPTILRLLVVMVIFWLKNTAIYSGIWTDNLTTYHRPLASYQTGRVASLSIYPISLSFPYSYWSQSCKIYKKESAIKNLLTALKLPIQNVSTTANAQNPIA